jgi:hypothetical protein
MRDTLEPIGLNLGEWVGRRIDAGVSCLVLASGIEARSDLVAGIATARQRAVVVLSNVPEQFRSALVRGGAAPGRFGLLPPATEPLEFSVRLAQFEAGAFLILAVAPEQAWLAEVLLALISAPPTAVVVDFAALAGDLHESLVRSRVLFERLHREIPGVPVVLAGDPMSPSHASILTSGAALESASVSPILPPDVRLRALRVRQERERIERIRLMCKERGRVVTIVAPSRGSAARLRTTLRGLGIDCGLYHGGLTAAERSAVLAASDGERFRVLVATEAILVEPTMARVDLVVFSYPPALPEAIVRAAGWSRSGARSLEIVVLFVWDDLRDVARRATSYAPSLADVRETYRSLRSIARDGHALWSVSGDDVVSQRSLRLGQLEVCLALLEMAGYCRRQDDFPRAATLVTLVEGGQLSSIPADFRSPPGRVSPLQLLQLAATMHLSAVALQRSLLDADRTGLVAFRPHGRERLYELLKPPASSAALLSRLVRDISTSAARSAATLPAVLAYGGKCRLQALAEALSWSAVPPCGQCDRCRPAPPPAQPQPISDVVVALSALAGVPFAMRRGAVHRVVAGALRHESRSADHQAVSALVDDLLARNLLESRQGQLGDLFDVGSVGRAALETWDQV